MRLKRRPLPGNVRRVVSTGDNLCGVITNKVGRPVQFESWAERSLLLRLDRDPTIKDYGSQPVQFSYLDQAGQQRTYTPDFIIWRHTGPIEIHEVTRTERQKWPQIGQREAAAREICQSRGWRYVVHTEDALPQGSELANLLALWRYRPLIYANQAVAEVAMRQLAEAGPQPLAAVVERMVSELDIAKPTVLAALGHMLWHGQLATDLHRLIFVAGRVAPEVCIHLMSDQGGAS